MKRSVHDKSCLDRNKAVKFAKNSNISSDSVSEHLSSQASASGCKTMFAVTPTSRFQKNFPFFRQPTEVGYFSHDCHRQFVHDSHQLKYYVPPSSVNFDLAKGYDIFIQKDESVKEYLDDLLRWIMLNQQKFYVEGGKQKGLSTDFICWRGLLTKILCTPYENREGWKIAVIKFNNTWYMCEYDTEEKIKNKAEMTDKQKLMTYMGWKFEQYVTSDTPRGVPDTSSPVNNKEAFCSVVRSRLADHSLVFGGEVDCTATDSEDHATCAKHYIELKTSYEFKHIGQERSFKRFKLLKFWAQSFLIGIKEIIVGFKDQNGVVRHLESFPTAKIPSLTKELQNPWEPTVCFNFLEEFLRHVKSTATIDSPRCTYVYEWSPGKNITYNKFEGLTEYSFLPEWYYNHDTAK